jgi:hypothetical protein
MGLLALAFSALALAFRRTFPARAAFFTGMLALTLGAYAWSIVLEAIALDSGHEIGWYGATQWFPREQFPVFFWVSQVFHGALGACIGYFGYRLVKDPNEAHHRSLGDEARARLWHVSVAIGLLLVGLAILLTDVIKRLAGYAAP